MSVLCFATGNLWRLMGKKDVMQVIQNLDVDGIEYTYGKFYNERVPSEKDFDILRNYKYVSTHAPFKLSLDLVSENEFNKTVKQMQSDYKQMKSKHIVFHPNIVLPKNMPKMTYVTENLNPKKGKTRRKLAFEDILKERKNWGLCLDASHAFDWGEQETGRIVKKWKRRITSIHFSNNRYHKDHMSFEKVSKKFLNSIEPILSLNVPIIIEEDMHYTKTNEIQAEINRIKNILSI
jgi:endonuclease IV